MSLDDDADKLCEAAGLSIHVAYSGCCGPLRGMGAFPCIASGGR